ncbi:transposase [Sulfurimicrobium lacus]|uniref:Transposase n=1 Tax=Sulfurimicrobium lacus TaxID=2715678 RepID=A0A6F8VCI4_9PROT|nr:Mu transposase C-terminal domain-containing protein [Sulfurimicrobium lacus]BCB26449.1 transposase [Sulfurimicrobium lacus]
MSKQPETAWYAASQLAGLAGMPTTKPGVINMATRESWEKRPRAGRGGGWEYPLTCLPKETQAALFTQLIAAPSAAAAPALSAPVSHELKDWQRKSAEARAAIIAEVKRLAGMAGTEKAVQAVIALAENNELPEQLQRLVPVANAKAGSDGKRTLSRRSIYRWMAESEQGFAALAPRISEGMKVPAWAPALLGLYQQPQKPSLKKCLDDLPSVLQPGIPAPSYWAAQRFVDKMSKLDLERGRMGPRELKSVRAYVKRDTSQMWPGDAYTADGHTFDAEVAHPAHGRPFRPEITSVIDIGTRKSVGWSIDLAESTWAVLDALRNAVETGGIPAIFYVDNGSGYKNALMGDEATGFMARLGITISHSLPYNSQARGLIERSHQSLWVRGAKDLPTYMGAPMDREAKQSSFKITRSDIKKVGTSSLLMPWAEFTAWCQDQVDSYNNRPHRGLPKITDAEGKRRHQTPNEAWDAAISEGWNPVEVEANESADLFRPYKEVTTRRALVQLFSNSYFHRDLEHYHGEKVRVGYDIHDAQHVWVRDREGRLICVAEFEGNKRSYFPMSAIEQAAEKRAKGRIKRAEAKIEEAEAELAPPALIEHQVAEQLPTMDLRTLHADLRKLDAEELTAANVIEMPKSKPARPMWDTDAAKYRWLMNNREHMTQDDQGWLTWYRNTSEWEDLFGDIEMAAW